MIYLLQINTIIFSDTDRFSRDIRLYLNKIQEFINMNIEVISASEEFEDTSSGRLRRNIKLAISQNEREKTIERVRAAHHTILQQNKVIIGRPPLGYVAVKTIINGQLKTTKWKINKNGEEIIKYIFNSFNEGLNINEIYKNIQIEYNKKILPGC